MHRGAKGGALTHTSNVSTSLAEVAAAVVRGRFLLWQLRVRVEAVKAAVAAVVLVIAVVHFGASGFAAISTIIPCDRQAPVQEGFGQSVFTVGRVRDFLCGVVPSPSKRTGANTSRRVS